MGDKRHPGDSSEQQDAEQVLISRLASQLGITLKKKRFIFGERGWFEIDAFSETPLVLCEAWAHQGSPKSAQKFKIMSDAFKLLYAASFVESSPRLILLFGDKEAAKHFTGESWMAEALRENGIEIQVVDLPEEVRKGIQEAQRRQYR